MHELGDQILLTIMGAWGISLRDNVRLRRRVGVGCHVVVQLLKIV